MSNIELRMPDSLVETLDMVGAVDELTRGEVIRQAVREWLDDLDLKWYAKEYDNLEEDDSEDSKEDDSHTGEEDVVVDPEDIEDETEEEDGDED